MSFHSRIYHRLIGMSYVMLFAPIVGQTCLVLKNIGYLLRGKYAGHSSHKFGNKIHNRPVLQIFLSGGMKIQIVFHYL